jgi:hypothetical protein
LNPMLMNPLILWFVTYIVIAIFHKIVKNKVGVSSEDYTYFKLPHFISLLLNSIVSVAIIFIILNASLSPKYETYLAVPYFGIMAYYFTSVFRTLKDAREGN